MPATGWQKLVGVKRGHWSTRAPGKGGRIKTGDRSMRKEEENREKMGKMKGVGSRTGGGRMGERGGNRRGGGVPAFWICDPDTSGDRSGLLDMTTW